MAEIVKLGLLGNNLGRSRAKNLHELLGELYKIQVTYTPMDLHDNPPPVRIGTELARCRDEGYRGVNVTHPYKRDAFQVVTTVKGFPVGLTSVNTVLLQGHTMLADNTDYSGCCRAFRSQFGQEFKPGRVLMLGTGGVGVAIAFALQTLGAAELVVADTNRELAREMVKRLAGGAMAIREAGPDIIAEMATADGLVNATPIGMFQYPGCAFPKEGIKKQQWAFDAVYTPENTELLDTCRRRGVAALSGFKLFLFQGLDAFVHFTGIMPEAGEVESLFLKRFPLE
jgi:shikimate dehydrogenase